MAQITMDTDWGAKGAQLSGAQVQAFIKEQLTDLRNQINVLKGMESQAHAASDGCVILYADAKIPKTANYWEWPALEQAGKKAIGVIVMSVGRAPIVVALDEIDGVAWDGNNTIAMNTEIPKESEAFADFDGYRNAMIFGFAAGDDVSNSGIGWCSIYNPASAITSYNKDWWAPSLGELSILSAHKNAINLCLSVITGAKPLSKDYYGSSTEAPDGCNWFIEMKTGNGIGTGAKEDPGTYRPITSVH